jgi:ATP-binding cassette subfamily F protein 3
MQLGKAIEKQEAEIERMERFIERFRYKASKARQAQDRIKKLDKMDKIERDPRDARTLGFRFGTAERSGRVVLELEDGRLEVPGRTLLEDGQLWLERGEHVSFVGPNGAGKTTLIDALAGRRPLEGGRVRRGHNVKLGYLSQHAEELGTTGTVLAAAQRATGLTPGKARALLGHFLFSGEEAEKPLEGLSGGERRRLSLAVLVHSGANVLILDEPTNHLDIDAREALEDALLQFDGSVLLVSHDRALLDAVGSRTIAIEDRRLTSYQGGWAEYSRAREEAQAAKAGGRSARQNRKPARSLPGAETGVADGKRKTGAGSGAKGAGPGAKEAGSGAKGAGSGAKGAAAGAKSGGAESGGANGAGANGRAGSAAAPGGGKRRGVSNNARRRLAALERDVERTEAALKALEVELAESDAWSTPERSEESTARHAAAKRAVEEAYSHWEAAAS